MNSQSSQFDWDAFHVDTMEASAAATGSWIRCLYKMRRSVTRGRLSLSISQYARLFGTSPEQAQAIITEISTLGIGEAETLSDGRITLTNRRLFREASGVTHRSYKEEEVSNRTSIPNEDNEITPSTSHVLSSSLPSNKVDKKEGSKSYVELAVRQVFIHWQKVLGHSKALMTIPRQKLIRARLKEGYTVEQLEKAIDGCKASPYHMGQNTNGAIYDSIGLIFRDGDKVEQFIGYLRKAPKKESFDAGKWDGVEKVVEDLPCEFCGKEQCFLTHKEERLAAA